MPFGLKEESVKRICRILRRYPQVDEAVIYGSRAKGTQKPGSDIDLTLKGEGLDLHTLNRISTELDDLLLPYTFDLSIYRHINSSELLGHIQRCGLPLYRKGS